jgi:hypothetical protein
MNKKTRTEAAAAAALKERDDREWKALVEESHITRTTLEKYIQEFEHGQREAFKKQFPGIAALDPATDWRDWFLNHKQGA